MSSSIWGTIVPSTTSGNQLAVYLNDFKAAVVSGFSGTSRPAQLEAGGYWIDTTLEGTQSIWEYKIWTGTTNITLLRINLATGAPSVSGSDSSFEISKISADSVGPILKLLKERIANAGQTLTSDTLGEIQFISSADDNSNPITAKIKVVASENTTATNAGSYLVFEATDDGSAARLEKMRLKDGKLGIGVTAPEAMVHAKGATVFKGERVEDTTSGVKSILKKKRSTGLGQTLNADVIGAHEFSSTTDTGAEATVASIRVEATETHTDSALGSKVVIGVKKIGQTSVTDVATFGETVTLPTATITTATVTTANITTANITTLNATTTNLGTVVETGDAQVVLNKAGTQATANAAPAGFKVEMSDATHAAIGYDSTKASKFVAGEVGALKEILTVDAAQAVTNKTLTLNDIDGGTASNSSRITLPKAAKATLDGLTRKAGTVLFDTDSGKPYYDDGVNLKVVGSGSGGGINFVVDGDAESADIFSAFADAAATSPVDGTGGSGSIAGGVTATSPLSGSKSFLFTKGASNLQGHGRSVAFTIDEANKGRTQEVSFDYIVNSGTFVAGNPSDLTSAGDSSVVVWIYDVTNAVLIQPTNYRLFSNSTTLSSKFRGTFQAASNSTSYRLILFVGRTETTAFELKLDSMSVGPQISNSGAVVTDWKSYTLTIGGATTAPTPGTNTSFAFWRRVGDTMEIRYEFSQTTAGSGGTGVYKFPLPSGYTADSSKVGGILGAGQSLGSFTAFNGTLVFEGHVQQWDTTNLYGYVGEAASNTSNISSTFLGLGNATIRYGFEAKVPIVGWSSNVQLSSDAGNSSYVFRANKAGGTFTGGANVSGFTNIFKNEGGAWNNTTGEYLVQSPGDYQVDLVFEASTANNVSKIYRTRSGVTTTFYNGDGFASNGFHGVRGLVTDCIAGDIIKVQPVATATLAAGAEGNTLSIFRLGNPQTIAANDTIAARYTSTAGNTVGTADTKLSFATKTFDTTGAYSSGDFLCGVAGKFEVNVFLTTAAVTLSTTQNFEASIYKNGVFYSAVASVKANGGASNAYRITGKDEVDCIATDVLSVYAKSDVATTLNTAAGYNHINFRRIN